jgi:hypothetical protein
MRRQGAGQLHPEVGAADGEQRPVATGLWHVQIAPRGVDRPPAQRTAISCCDMPVAAVFMELQAYNTAHERAPTHESVLPVGLVLLS